MISFPIYISDGKVLLVKNGLKIIVIVREGDSTMSILRRKGDNILERVFCYYYYGSVNALATAHGLFADFVKVKKT